MAEHSLPVRAVWFLLVGWWLTPILVNVAWLLHLTIVLIPVGITLINLVPTALTLKEPRSSRRERSSAQSSLFVRAIWFVLVGWWLSFLWANLAALFAVTIIGLPVTIWMAHRLPYVTSLYRFDG
ncbi:YccF domain-containing protein [Natronobiforma cellulositropha]|uniref:YccF domain-containing protein n=1 Tax=Natronobiforma cellulositropha TaxID=1679076 RepID=UPI0021D58240|nr:YccF domain-containing protein [Natronobiforma cellulositropha]